MDAILSNAISRCPFLAAVARQEGDSFAKQIAINPSVPALTAPRRPVLEDFEEYQTTFRAWHGAAGVVPLAHIATSQAESVAHVEPQLSCPYQAALQPSQPVVPPQQRRHGAASRPLPLATMSLSSFGGMPDFGKFLKAFQQQHLRKPTQQNKPSQQGPKPKEHRPGAPGSRVNSTITANGSTAATPEGGLCPMRKVLGPLAPLVFNPKGHFQCPEPIMRARAALAATKPVRHLRPQALPVKLLAVGATTAAVNVPCGMWREHTEKFSVPWFVAVHASIPFIAMLRKAVIMPKYAIIFTIATAIAGQAMGAKLERKRLAHACETAAADAVVAPLVHAPTKPVISSSYNISSSDSSSSTLATASLTASTGRAGRKQRAAGSQRAQHNVQQGMQVAPLQPQHSSSMLEPLHAWSLPKLLEVR